MADGSTKICATLACKTCGTPVGANLQSPPDRRYANLIVRRNGDFADIAAGDKISREFLEPVRLQLLHLNEGAYLQLEDQTLPLASLFEPLLLRLEELERRLSELGGAV